MSERLVLVGGGTFATRFFEALAADAAAPEPLELRWIGSDRARTTAAADHARALLARVRPRWRLAAGVDFAAGVRGATLIVLMARIGGLEARAADEALALRHGMAGDEGLGIGGVANAWRTVPVVRRFAATIRREAPAATVVNLMAPLGMTTRALHEGGVAATGLCELPLLTLRSWRASGDAPAAELAPALAHPPAPAADGADDLDYAGLNHLGFFWPRGARGAAWLATLAQRGAIDGALLAARGGAPLHYYEALIEPEVGARRGRLRPVGRALALIELRERALAQMRTAPGSPVAALAERPTPWFDALLAPTVAALLAGGAVDGFFDVRNATRLPGLPADVVVELPATLARAGAAVRVPTALPPPIAAFLAAAAEWEERSYRAARDRDRAQLRAALLAWPGAWPRPARAAFEELVESIAGSDPAEERP
ncbi:MAG: hypothetical protein JNL90_00525 [Planctomycetes bacterium]|nr:hypothetical protein [Planctomycetota bacterium]